MDLLLSFILFILRMGLYLIVKVRKAYRAFILKSYSSIIIMFKISSGQLPYQHDEQRKIHVHIQVDIGRVEEWVFIK